MYNENNFSNISVDSIVNLTSKDIKKLTSSEISKLPIQFWEHISFQAISKISKTQLRDLDKIQLEKVRKIIYDRFNVLKSKEYYSLINRIQFTLMILRRTSAPNIYIDGVEYTSMYQFYKLLRYTTVPEHSVIKRIEEHLEVYLNNDNNTLYYSVRSCIKIINEFYIGPEKELLTDLPDEFLTIKEAMTILGLSPRGRETLNERIGCYKIGRFKHNSENEHPNKAKRTLFLLDDIKKYAYRSNKSGVFRMGVLDDGQVDYLLEKRYTDVKDK